MNVLGQPLQEHFTKDQLKPPTTSYERIYNGVRQEIRLPFTNADTALGKTLMLINPENKVIRISYKFFQAIDKSLAKVAKFLVR